jgi:hypothetical protein
MRMPADAVLEKVAAAADELTKIMQNA